jgi:uncharacterized protein involved in type VI secretion and phage assembly
MSIDGHDLLGPINAEHGQPWYGVYPAIVTDVADPDGQGRIKVRLPWTPDAGGSSYDVWARLATAMAGDERGTWFVPDPGDEVLVAFGAGDPDHPYVVGSMWNGKDDAPVAMTPGNDVRAIVSREDIRITMQDTAGSAKLTLTTPGGRAITLDDAARTVTIDDGNGNTLEMTPSGVTVTASARVTINAMSVDVSAASVNVDAAISSFSGVVKCDTLITNSVVSASYTPGMGNVW